MIHLEYDDASLMFFKVFDAEDAGWSAAPGRAAGATNRRGPGPPIGPPAAPQAAAEELRNPAAPRAPRDSGDERRQLRAPELAPCSERGSCVQPPTPLIWMGLALTLGGPLLMMASPAEARAISVP